MQDEGKMLSKRGFFCFHINSSIFQSGGGQEIQGDSNQILLFQMALTLKKYISDTYILHPNYIVNILRPSKFILVLPTLVKNAFFRVIAI